MLLCISDKQYKRVSCYILIIRLLLYSTYSIFSCYDIFGYGIPNSIQLLITFIKYIVKNFFSIKMPDIKEHNDIKQICVSLLIKKVLEKCWTKLHRIYYFIWLSQKMIINYSNCNHFSLNFFQIFFSMHHWYAKLFHWYYILISKREF